MALTEQALRRFLPLLPDAAGWMQPLTSACARFSISTPERQAAFLAQVAHESGGFIRLEENLRYSAARLRDVFPRRFPTLEGAKSFEFQPEKIANLVYSNRLGNGPAESGDGFRYRGRGLIQLTGRSNYRSAGTALGVPLETSPDLLLQRELAVLAAAQFWQSRGLNELADHNDADNDDEDFVIISIRINGGREGLERRKELWQRARAALR
jgi:putative chitinase